MDKELLLETQDGVLCPYSKCLHEYYCNEKNKKKKISSRDAHGLVLSFTGQTKWKHLYILKTNMLN